MPSASGDLCGTSEGRAWMAFEAVSPWRRPLKTPLCCTGLCKASQNCQTSERRADRQKIGKQRTLGYRFQGV